MTAKRKASDKDAAAVFQVTTPTDIVIDPDPLTGRAYVTVPPAATASVTFPENVAQIDLLYDIQVETQTGIVQTVANGKLSVVRDITQAG